MRGHTDRVIGVLLGILLGIAIVAAFVFLGSGETIDDPSINNEPVPTQTAPAEPGSGPGQGDAPNP